MMSIFDTDAYQERQTDDYMVEQERISNMCQEFNELKKENAKYKKALEEIASGRCMLHFEYYDIAKAALNG